MPYIIVTHGDFLETNEDEKLRYLDNEKIIAWFSIHPPKAWHIKYFPIPLGVFQKKELFARQKELSVLFKQLRDTPKTHLLSGIFDTSLVPERAKLAKLFKEKPFYTASKSGISFDRYMKTLASSVFTLSPRGWGPDCYRTWEALLVGTIPIVKRGESGILERAKNNLRNYFFPFNDTIHSQLDRLYDNLPVLVIDDWNEITEEFLKKKYKEITSKKYNINMLYIEYWHNIILTVQKEYLKNYIPHHPHLTKTAKKNDKESSKIQNEHLKKAKQNEAAVTKIEKEIDKVVSTTQNERLKNVKQNEAAVTKIEKEIDKVVSTIQNEYAHKHTETPLNAPTEYFVRPRHTSALTEKRNPELTAAQILYLNKYKHDFSEGEITNSENNKELYTAPQEYVNSTSTALERIEKENNKELYNDANEDLNKIKPHSSQKKRRKRRREKLSTKLDEYLKKRDQNLVV